MRSFFFSLLVVVAILGNQEGIAASDKESSLKERLVELTKDNCRGSRYAKIRQDMLLNFQAEEIRALLKKLDVSPNDATRRILLGILAERIEATEAFEKVLEKLRACVFAELDSRKKATMAGYITRSIRHLMPDPMWKGLKCLPEIEAKKRIAETESLLKREMQPGPGLTQEQAIQMYMEELRQRIWYREMPSLGPALLEIAIKRWPNDAEAEELSKQGWGEDFFRNMAIHLLGELQYTPAAPALLAIVQDEKELYYSRSHAMRALCKIAAPETLKPLFLFRCRELCRYEATPEEQRHNLKLVDEFSFENFSAEQALDICLEALQDAKSAEEKRVIINWGISYCDKAPDFARKVHEPLNRIAAEGEDVRLRRAAANVLEGIRLKQLPEHEREENLEFKWLVEGRLEPDQVIGIDDEEVLEDAFRNKADPREVKRICKKYLDTIRRVAAEYDNANAFATVRLHNKGWPDNVANVAARETLKLLRSFTPGMDSATVLGQLCQIDPAFEKDYQEAPEGAIMRFGNISYLWYLRTFDEEVDTGFGIKRKDIDAVMVFENDKLIIVHMPR